MANRFPEPTEAKRFLKRKLNIETDSWDELKWGEHSHAFTVAHSVRANILDDIHGLINKAIGNGESFETFRKGMLETMTKTGWYGKAGKTAEDKVYINWRIRIMYDTNMRTAYSASRYREQLENASDRPIWVYLSKVQGKNRRQEHIFLHNKAFRYDDPFWNNYYPPNGWGCQCRVTTKSEHGAERDGIKILKSDANGKLPEISGMDWDTFDPTWQYNPALEALSPSFERYKHLEQAGELETVRARFRADMEKIKMTVGELKILKNEMAKRKSGHDATLYLIGNLDAARQEAMNINDSRIMASGYDLEQALNANSIKQAIPEELFQDLYETIQSPEEIYENPNPNQPRYGREFHFLRKVKNQNGGVLNIVLRKPRDFALRIITMGLGDEQANKNYKKIW
jgi:hypothetical protein